MALPRITSPHATGSNRTQRVMLLVLAATLPGVIVLTWLYGAGTLINLCWASAVALGFEALLLKVRQRPVQFFLRDGSALVTAVLLALALPPYSPWWLTLIATGSAIVFGKQLYGGLGQNPFNPAMIGYVVVLVSFPVEMTTWPVPHSVGLGAGLQHILGIAALPDGWSQATALDVMKLNRSLTVEELWTNPAFGHFGGIGSEVVNLAFLAGGLFLLHKRLVQLARAGGHARGAGGDEPGVLERLGLRQPRLAAVSPAQRRHHARRLLHRHRPGERGHQYPGAAYLRRWRRHSRLCDPCLGRLSGRRRLRRAADEPGGADHRLLHPPAHLRPPQGRARLQAGRMT